ncbi:MAG: asparagine synthase C-terminal domain-containing protein, partial [Bacteroidales bacterium]
PDFYREILLKESYTNLPRKLNPAELQSLFDLNYYLKDDLLVKVDRASMHYSLETRVPLLDYRIVEFAYNLSPDLRYRNGISKYLLKKVLYNYIPSTYFDRPKWGFAIPLQKWLKNDLKYLIDDFLSEEKVKTTGIFNYRCIEKLKNDFFFNDRNYLYNRLWQAIILQKFLSV